MTLLMDNLTEVTGLSAIDLQRVMARAPVRYKTYTIPKRSGDGVRIIAQPAREVKFVQRALNAVLLKKLPVHACATAYITGSSIRTNAEPHANGGPILKLDLKNFFPSIRGTDWATYCRRTGCLIDETDILLTTRLLFRRVPAQRGLRLAIGAPTSPTLSNVLMHEIDVRIFETLAKEYVIYTRYADDMTFSAPRTGFLNGVMSSVARIIRETDSPSLDINGEKTTFVTTKFRRSVTGLTLANDGRVTIGRERKRKIFAAVHHAKYGKLNRSEMRMLAGMLAYANSVEPDFMEVLERKYGQALIGAIRKAVTIGGGRVPPHLPPLASV